MSKQAILDSIAAPYLKTDLPLIEPGDTVKAYLKIREGDKERIQVFEGNVIALKNGGIHRTVTLRKVSYGVGVEKLLPLHSPLVEKFEVVRKGKVRRAKLYYLRKLAGKKAKIKERR